MRQDSVQRLVSSGYFTSLRPGPLAVIFVEDDVAVAETLEHHLTLGFAGLLLVGQRGGELELPEGVVHLTRPIQRRDDAVSVINSLIPFVHGRWLYWCFNTEFLFYPYSETRAVSDLATFMEDERREAVFSYAIDLYARDLYAHPSTFSREDAHLDRSGYYGFQRFRDGEALERQVNVFGGLGWRYEEFIPWERRRIDRISLFRAKPGLTMRPDLTLSDEEMNTVACPWHHNVTAAVVSFRVAKALKRNPGSTYEIESMMWRQSTRFEWRSEQLLELGFMEPGQWF